MRSFKDAMIALRQKMDAQFDDLLLMQPDIPEIALKETLPTIAPEAEVLRSDLIEAIRRDKTRYFPKKTPVLEKEEVPHPQKPTLDTNVFTRKPQQQFFKAAPLLNLPFLDDKEGEEVPFLPSQALKESAEPLPAGSAPAVEESTEQRESVEQNSQNAASGVEVPNAPIVPAVPAIPSENKCLAHLLAEEIDLAQKAPEIYQSSLTAIEKLPKVISIYLQGQSAPAFASLQALCEEHPNDRLVAYAAAHMFYHRVASGQSQLLPQARQYAKKAMAESENVAIDVLYRFRYHCITLDAGFAPDRLLEMIRSYGLLKPFTDLSKKTKEEAILFMKVLALFSETEVEKWAEVDMQTLSDVLLSVLGGGFLYRALFFMKLAPYLVRDKGGKAHVFAPLQPVHERVSAVFLGLDGLTLAPQPAQEKRVLHSQEEGEKPASPLIWTVSQKLMKACQKHLPIPEADAVLLNISLDGLQRTSTEAFDASLQTQEVFIGSFWGFWAHQLLPVEGVYMPHNLPNHVAAAERPFLKDFTELLEVLKLEEQRQIDHERWPHLLPYYVLYRYADMASAGAGQSYRPSIFMPPVPSLKACYLAWGGEGSPQKFFSEIIKERAERGGFASLREVRAAFEGVMKLINDAEYGIKAKQNKAWRVYLGQQNDGQANKKRRSASLFTKVLAEVWWFFILIAPSGIMAAVAVASATQLPFGVQMLLLILIAAGFFTAGIYAMHQAKAVKKKQPKLRTMIDEEGNVHLGS